MGQSLSQLYVHLVFRTKNSYPFLNSRIEKQLHAYVAGTLKAYDSPALIINSVPDHIHTLFRLSKNHALSKVTEEVKKQSSKWIKGIDGGNIKFKWQIGYGAFSVSSYNVDVVRPYIQNQKQHHQKVTLRTEVEKFMKDYDVVEYNQDYFWSEGEK